MPFYRLFSTQTLGRSFKNIIQIMCSTAQPFSLVPDFTQRHGWQYPMARLSLPLWFHPESFSCSLCPSHKCFLECTREVWICLGNCSGCIYQLKFFSHRYSHRQFLRPHWKTLFKSHPHNSHPIQNSNLSCPLSWHSRTPLYQSTFSFSTELITF